MTGLDTTVYHLSDKHRKRLAVVADLHDSPFDELLSLLKEQKPDVICIPGDIGIRHVSNYPRDNTIYREPEYALDFLREAKGIAPVIMSRGNHEYRWDGYDVAELVGRGIIFVENGWTEQAGLLFAGLPSCYPRTGKRADPELLWLDAFERQRGYKVLLCHHPEYYTPFIRGREIDLVLSGHAHGGQFRIGQQGLYAPGQGLFPKLTSGIYDGKLVISRGLSNNKRRIPRINNPFELVIVEL